MNNQAFLFLIFIINGILVGFLFDIFRVLRKSFKTSDIITYIEDILFWIVAGVLTLYFIFNYNNGEIRFFIFLGIILGISIYILTISKYFMKITVGIISIIKQIVKKIIIYPLKFILNIVKKLLFRPISFIIINIRKIFTKNKITFLHYFKNIKKSQKSTKNET